jgi:hypothetical protein
VKALDSKLEAIRHCILHGWNEDAQNHIFDLLRGCAVQESAASALRPEGKQRKASLMATSIASISSGGGFLSAFGPGELKVMEVAMSEAFRACFWRQRHCLADSCHRKPRSKSNM